ncbi:DNA-binding response regulator [Pandoraea terrae]|uniref:DNA-binding response regulator n=1 Tax=Pandoraea terrae TaxID=1537710 RepID=A0A5E4W959_9BURK|nr:XrtB/PEP-CTERM-associated transcriptional regulator EpsA [Pandoraea terrae]VVE20399.1 DNA-binding response regulator [Pandoraea terrae]
MSFLSHFRAEELGQFLTLVQQSLRVRRHVDLFKWLQGDVQLFLPHGVMIAAWGDFSLGPSWFDVVSPLPGARTDRLCETEVSPFLKRLFDHWLSLGRHPYAIELKDEMFSPPPHTTGGLKECVREMSSALVHGIKDERGRHDCLYVVLGTEVLMNPASREALEVLLPYVDTALRQVTPLPGKHTAKSEAAEASLDLDGLGLSPREREILDWVRNGKTNQEIGMILDISAFTVKNHLRRIFQKLNVMNRAQAVATFEKLARTVRT